MDTRYNDCTPEKLTDELERKLIQREIDNAPPRSQHGRSILVLETVVGTLLLLGMLLLAARFG